MTPLRELLDNVQLIRVEFSDRWIVRDRSGEPYGWITHTEKWAAETESGGIGGIEAREAAIRWLVKRWREAHTNHRPYRLANRYPRFRRLY